MNTFFYIILFIFLVCVIIFSLLILGLIIASPWISNNVLLGVRNSFIYNNFQDTLYDVSSQATTQVLGIRQLFYSFADIVEDLYFPIPGFVLIILHFFPGINKNDIITYFEPFVIAANQTFVQQTPTFLGI